MIHVLSSITAPQSVAIVNINMEDDRSIETSYRVQWEHSPGDQPLKGLIRISENILIILRTVLFTPQFHYLTRSSIDQTDDYRKCKYTQSDTLHSSQATRYYRLFCVSVELLNRNPSSYLPIWLVFIMPSDSLRRNVNPTLYNLLS